MKTIRFIKYVLMAALVIAGLSFFSSCEEDDDDDDDGDTQVSYTQGTTQFTVDAENATVTIKDNGEGLGGDYTMSADTTYILDGRVFVNNGQTLTVEAGTMVQGQPGTGENASALIVAQGGKIMANGTKDAPIVFTAETDTYDGSGFGLKERGLWGGLVVLGKSVTNNDSQERVEGIPETEPRGFYGGSNAADNSGVLKYISIRHGGSEIGEGNEINGLTLGGVGTGTEIDYVEVIANKDDGIEWFGGTARVKHALVSYCGDDSYDYDQGFQGYGQYWVAIQDKEEGQGDRLAEQDGGGSGEGGANETQSQPKIYNATYVGNGGKLMIFRDQSGGEYANSIFVNTADGIRIELRDDKTSSWDMFEAGLLNIKNNVGYAIATDDDAYMFVKPEEDDEGNPLGEEAGTDDADALAHWNDNNVIEDLGIKADGEGLNIVPTGVGSNGVADVPDAWFDQAGYHGAIDPNGEDWTKGWTLTFN